MTVDLFGWRLWVRAWNSSKRGRYETTMMSVGRIIYAWRNYEHVSFNWQGD